MNQYSPEDIIALQTALNNCQPTLLDPPWAATAARMVADALPRMKDIQQSPYFKEMYASSCRYNPGFHGVYQMIYEVPYADLPNHMDTREPARCILLWRLQQGR